jgi:membrane protein YqaA with SNARE-associated domain
MSWFAIVPALFVQEFAALTATLALAYRSGAFTTFTEFALALVWAVATVIDIGVGYFLGKYLGGRVFAKSRPKLALERWAKKFEARVGKSGKSFSLMLLGFALFPYVAGFIAAWTDLSFKDSLLYISIGDVIWFGFAWATAIGLAAAVPNIKILIIAVICLAIVVSLIFNHLRRKIF